MRRSRTAWIALIAIALQVSPTGAQVLGTFPWQMQPYCNVATLTLTGTPGGGWVLDGTDDQCGAPNKASVVGVATFSAAGNVTLNFLIVTAPSGKPVHVSAIVSPVNGNGTWTDSVGNTGTFAFFGTTPGLAARPLPASGLPPGVITGTDIAAGAVGGSDINPAEVQARLTGTCGAGTAITAIAANGAVTCAPATDAAVDFRATNGQVATVPPSSDTTIQFSTVIYNTGGGAYDPATGVYVVPTSGVYAITYAVGWNAPATTGGRFCAFVTTTPYPVTAVNCIPAVANSGAAVMAGSTVLRLTAGDSIRVNTNQSSGAAVAFAWDVDELTVVRLR